MIERNMYMLKINQIVELKKHGITTLSQLAFFNL